MNEGDVKRIEIMCLGKCELNKTYSLFDFGGDTDLYISEKGYFNSSGIKCYYHTCVCAGSSSHPKHEDCLIQASVGQNKLYLTVKAYRATKNVFVYILIDNMSKMKVIPDKGMGKGK